MFTFQVVVSEKEVYAIDYSLIKEGELSLSWITEALSRHDVDCTNKHLITEGGVVSLIDFPKRKIVIFFFGDRFLLIKRVTVNCTITTFQKKL